MSDLLNRQDALIEIEQPREKWYETIPFPDEASPIRILQNREKRTADAVTWHEQIEILCIREGNLICECDFVHYICKPGDIIIINPCEAHAVFPFEKPARFDCLMIDPRLCGSRDDINVQKFMESYTERRIRFVTNIGPETEALLHPVIDELICEYTAKETGYELAVKGNLLRLLAILFRREVRQEESIPRRGNYESIAPALQYIAGHYTQDISLADLSSLCCMNRSYFCRQFHEITGKTAMVYVNEYRLAKAKALLLTTNDSICEIAISTGFSDNSYFTRKFKELYGISPSAMRRKVPKL